MSQTRRSALALSGLAAVATSVLTLCVAVRALDRAILEPGPAASSLGLALASRVRALEQRSPIPPSIVFLGDSTVMAYGPGHKVPDALQRRLSRDAGVAARVENFAAQGMSSLDFFVVATQLEGSPVEVAVVPVNLASFSASWQTLWVRPETTGWIPFDHVIELMRLPTHWFGVTLDRFLFYSAIVGTDQATLWNRAQRAQVKVGKSIERARKRAQLGAHPLASGMPFIPFGTFSGRSDRQAAENVNEVYGLAMRGVESDHPVIQLLRATVREFESNGIRTVAYVVPFNVGWARSLGLYDGAGVARSVHAIGSALEAEGALVVDLHDLLPDRGFRDAGNHFTVDDQIDGPDRVAIRLAPLVSAQLQN